jgi:hypothetical protein
MSLTKVITDGNGAFIRVDVCTCEVGKPGFHIAEDDWQPTDETCPLYDNHMALAKARRKIP